MMNRALVRSLGVGALLLLPGAATAQTELPASCGGSEGIVGLHRGAGGEVVLLCRDRLWGWSADLSQSEVFPFGRMVNQVTVGPGALLFAIWSDTVGVTDGAGDFENLGLSPRSGMSLAPSSEGIFLFGGEPTSPPHIVYELDSGSEPFPVALVPEAAVDVTRGGDTLYVASRSGVYRQIGEVLEPYFGVEAALAVTALDRTPTGSLLLAVGNGVLEVAPGGGGARWVHRGPADDVLWAPSAIYVLNRTGQRISVVDPEVRVSVDPEAKVAVDPAPKAAAASGAKDPPMPRREPDRESGPLESPELQRLNDIVGTLGGRLWIEGGYLFYEGRRDRGAGALLPVRRGPLDRLDAASIRVEEYPLAVVVRCAGPQPCIFTREEYSDIEVPATRLALLVDRGDEQALADALRALLRRY